MILIPEIETVVLLVPRTGSGTLKRALLKAYPKAMMPYRHMEADGVPGGYDRWRKVGVVRHPVDRLWSLYKFCRDNVRGQIHPTYGERVRRSTTRSFSDWILDNDVIFTDPYDSAGSLKFYPQYAVRHALPENRKSQFVTLRPDLGTTVVPFRQLSWLACRLGIELDEHHNRTEAGAAPELTREAADHIKRFFAWDLNATSADEAMRDTA